MSENTEVKQNTANRVALSGRKRNTHRLDCNCGFCKKMEWIKRRHSEKRAVVEQIAGAPKAKKTKFIRALLTPGPDSGNLEKAAMAAGYSPRSAGARGRQLIQEPDVRNRVIRALERAGIGLDSLSDGLGNLLQATDTRYFSHEGTVTDEREVADNNTRLKAHELAYRLHGALAQEGPQVQAALIIKVPERALSEDDWEDERARGLADKNVTPGDVGK